MFARLLSRLISRLLSSKYFQDILAKLSGGAAIQNVPAVSVLKDIEAAWNPKFNTSNEPLLRKWAGDDEDRYEHINVENIYINE